MVFADADKGSLRASANDNRITKVGNFIHRVRWMNSAIGQCSQRRGVSLCARTRPEVPRYTEQ